MTTTTRTTTKHVALLAALALLLLPHRLPRFVENAAAIAAPAALPIAEPLAAPLAAPLRVLKGTVGRNTTLETILSPAVSRAVVQEVVSAARPVYDLARLSVGHPFDLAVGSDGLLAVFNYGIDELRTLRVQRTGSALQADVLTRSYDVRPETAEGVIDSSLFGAVEAAGEGDQLALDLSTIFEWDVDFNTELQPGDSFKVAVEKLYLDDRFVRYGRILSAEMHCGDRLLRAVRFEGGRRPEYYTPDGLSVRKTFLRSPLRFTRISSRFTRARLHPILNRVRPHFGVDYAAPAGTPVRAAADGRVIAAGWDGGFGNVVRIRHGRGVDTLYGHLSRVTVKRGQRVEQGELIGAVGSTGLSTGPHLDYRTVKNGVLVNPLTIEPPPAEPVPDSQRSAFAAVRDQYLALLDRGSRAVDAGPPATRADAARPDASRSTTP
jgi:murein DD-endopeptidase MepM/ murein hydrolase activator NlpD